jgi:hypothetical protein
MNIIGDLRYVTKEEYAAYATPQSEETREKAYRDYVKYLNSRAKRLNHLAPAPDEKFKEQWLAKRPGGYFEHRSAFAAHGKYGQWLSGKNAVVKINGILFLHGGISEQVSARSVREINEQVRQELSNFYQLRSKFVKAGIIEEFFMLDEAIEQAKKELDYLKSHPELGGPQTARELEIFSSIGSWYISHPLGPLWYRAYGTEPEESFGPTVEKILANLKAKNIVVGHTTFLKGIAVRFGGKVLMIDTGMLRKHYKGRCSALVIENNKFTPVYPATGPCS